MAIKTVRATINGQTYTLALNSSTGKWEATITAPGKTSYGQSGGQAGRHGGGGLRHQLHGHHQ